MKHIDKQHFSFSSGRWLLVLLTVTLAGWGISGCEKQDLDKTFDGPYFVRFTDTTLTYKESYSKPITIQVHNVGPQLTEAITINYTVSGTAREGKDYTIVGTKGKVVIPANKSTGTISVKLINNANNILESHSLNFTLTSVSPASLQVGFGKGEVPIGKVFKLIIQDDCLFGGSYTGTSRLGNQNYTVSDAEITSTDCKTYTLKNWNIALLDFNAIKPTLTFVDNGDNSLTIPSQTNTELSSTDRISGTGAWNPIDRKITLNLQLTVRQTNGRDTTLTFPQTYTPQ
ncbi:DUF4843 domain-containing protein [Spirosoma sp. BT702]|uniref:DUF4843 domain-containing protein n=1 Tax=Spirosoma profusum TaxID=2771354 RepID=A0A926XZP4_9BACT|nr:Calx-beta domain-containing protein [Spirosoma profusum]MBD2701207.1 DUF4843 domain-containing protein [Spirosoma profusum]